MRRAFEYSQITLCFFFITSFLFYGITWLSNAYTEQPLPLFFSMAYLLMALAGFIHDGWQLREDLTSSYETIAWMGILLSLFLFVFNMSFTLITAYLETPFTLNELGPILISSFDPVLQTILLYIPLAPILTILGAYSADIFS